MVKTKLKCAAGSDPGRIRRNNEDAFYMDTERGIFLVVDGIGGQAAGEKAAEIAVDRLRARLERQTGTTEQRIREAITMANNEILRASQTNPEWDGMACVLTVAVLENGSAVVGHVGDSRLYQIQPGRIRKITHDHSPVGEREDREELTEAEAMRHPRRNEVFRDVGSEEHEPDDPDFIEIQKLRFEPNSAILICSDGLSDQVPSDRIKGSVEQNAGNPEAAVKELIEAANRAGGKDNVTVLVVEGEQFTAPASLPEAARDSSGSLLAAVLGSRPAVFLYALLIAAAAAWFSRPYWDLPPVTITPRTLIVGNKAKYTTITQALADARSGDTVEVQVGDYPEQVKLISGVTLISSKPREAVIRAAPVANGPAVIAENVTNARISCFRIVADQKMPLPVGIDIHNSDVEVDNMEIEGAGIGIQIRAGGDASPLLLGNAIHDSLAEGILITGSSAPWLYHNSFQRNKGANLAARNEAKPVLSGNIFDKPSLDLPTEIPAEQVRDHNFFLAPPPTTHKSVGGAKK
jgi:serine/threonine protein phosphatase PrpC